MVVRGDLTLSLKSLILRYFFNKNAKNIFKILLGNSVFKAQKMVMKTLLFNTKTQVCPKIGTLRFKHLPFLSFKRLNG